MDGARRERVIVKVLVLGAANAGKTSLIERYVNGAFTGLRRATVGSDFSTRVLDLEDRDVVLQVWDTAGQERFGSASVGASYFRSSDGALLVYDCICEKSVEQLAQWRDEAMARVQPGVPFPVVIIANKADLRKSLPDECAAIIQSVVTWAIDAGIPHLETSAKDGDGVEAAMMAIAALALEAKRTKQQMHASAAGATEDVVRPSFVLGGGRGGGRGASSGSLDDLYTPKEPQPCAGGKCA